MRCSAIPRYHDGCDVPVVPVVVAVGIVVVVGRGVWGWGGEGSVSYLAVLVAFLTGFTKLIHTVEPIPSATVMGAKIGPIPMKFDENRFKSYDFGVKESFPHGPGA